MTEKNIRDNYGVLYMNGQGPADAPDPSLPISPLFNFAQPAQPATQKAPKVLRRAAISVTPKGTATPPAGFAAADFDDFSDDNDLPTLADPNVKYVDNIFQNFQRYTNSKWNFYTHGAGYSDFFPNHGRMNMTLADMGQDIMSANYMVPKGRALKMPTDAEAGKYLHITFETQMNAIQRRYWWMGICGPSQIGKTFKDDGSLVQPYAIIPFFEATGNKGNNPSQAGWNCIHLVEQLGYDGIEPILSAYGKWTGGRWDYKSVEEMKAIPGFDLSDSWASKNNYVKRYARSSTALKLIINKPVPAGNGSGYNSGFDSVINVKPSGGCADCVGWQRALNGSKKVTGVLLDDQMAANQMAKMDLYIRNDRLIMYINGQQRMCTTFYYTKPDQNGNPVPVGYKLSMAEGGLALGQILYHSMAEVNTMTRDDWLYTGQRHYRKNIPFADPRSFDNVGWQESTTPPADFNSANCVDWTPSADDL
jgi:hypothetical protein